jgi:hypothetical protein
LSATRQFYRSLKNVDADNVYADSSKLGTLTTRLMQ